MSKYRPAKVDVLDDGRIRERHFGTKDARKAKALAITNGWQYQWIENANGFHKPLRRSDGIIVRPKDANAVPPLRRTYQDGQWELGVGRHPTLAENGQFFIRGEFTAITADLDQWDTFRLLVANMDQEIQRHRKRAEDDNVAGDTAAPTEG